MKWIIKQFGNVWCLFVHGFVLDKHKMHKAYGPQECQKCGRWWDLKQSGEEIKSYGNFNGLFSMDNHLYILDRIHTW